MRLKLDKLFLSAGLALAVIATTIPVGAGVNTTTANGVTTVDGVVGYATTDGLPLTTESTKSLMAAISGVSTADTSAVETGVGGVKKQDALPSGLTVNKELFTGNQDVTAYIEEVDADYEFGKGYKVGSDEDAFTQTTTYTVSGYEYTSTTAGNAVAAATAAKTAIINALKIESGSNSYSTYTVSVSENALTAHTASQPTEDSYAEGTKFTVDGSFTVTKTYTITSLPEGYRYDIVLAKDNTKNNLEYKVAYNEETTNKEYTNITDLDEEIVVSLTKLSGTYYLGKKTVSASGNLLFALTEGDDAGDVNVVSGDYTARITNGSDEEIDLTEVADLPEDVKSAGKFKITVTKDGDGVTNGPEMTFKIAIPKDVQPTSADKKINWIVVRGHNYDDGNGIKYEIISSTVEGDYIVFSSDKFSTYALLYTEVAADAAETPAEDPTTEAPAEDPTQAPATTPEAGQGSGTTSPTGVKSGDNSMMPLFMTTLLLALCAGSLAIYKEKKTN